MKTAQEKLDYILSELERVVLPDELNHHDQFWDRVQARCDNATDEIYDTDLFHKKLIKVIEDE